MNANYKQFLGPLVVLIIGFVAGVFYGQSTHGRYELKANAFAFDTVTGKVAPVEFPKKPFDWDKYPDASK